MNIITDNSFNVIDEENIYDFVKHYGILSLDEDQNLVLKLDFKDLPYSKQIALIRYEDEDYEQSILEYHYERLDKSALFRLLNGDDLADARDDFRKEVDDLAIEVYEEQCQELINFFCEQVADAERGALLDGLRDSE